MKYLDNSNLKFRDFLNYINKYGIHWKLHGFFNFFIVFIFQMIWIFYWILKAFLKGAIVENALVFNIPVT